MILFISWIYRYVKLVDLKNKLRLTCQQNPRESSEFCWSFGSDWGEVKRGFTVVPSLFSKQILVEKNGQICEVKCEEAFFRKS